MSSEAEELRQQIAELKERLSRLEACLDSRSDLRSPAPPSPVPAALAQNNPSFAPPVIYSRAIPGTQPGLSLPSSSSSEDQDSHRSLETRIGSQIFNRVGIVAVLIGVAWFLKLAIDNQWIGPAGRIITGLVAGAGLIALSERLRARGYSAFSYSLKAIATGVLYLSLWAAYALFHLINGKVAFTAMVAVTAFNALMCWMQNSEVLAFYAAIGGFLTPMLLAVHAGTELTLFGYLLLLDIAVVILIALRPWSRLLLAAFCGTVFYAVGWYAVDYGEEKFGVTLFFIVAFFLLFAVSPQLLRSLRTPSSSAFPVFEDSLALRLLPAVNAALSFAEVFLLMSNFGHLKIRPWIALPFVAFYLLMAKLKSRDKSQASPSPIDTILAVAFITVAISMILHGRWIAAGWFLEFAILLWLAATRSISLSRVLAAWVFSLGVIALILPIDTFHPSFRWILLLNPRFAVYFWAIAVCLFAARISTGEMEKDSSAQHGWLAWTSFAAVTGLAATVLLMIAVCLEIHAYWSGSTLAAPGGSIAGTSPETFTDEQFSYSAWMMLFGAALLAAGFWRKSAFLRWQALVLLALSIAKVFLVDTQQLSQGYRIFSFLGLGALLLTVSFVYQKDWLGLRGSSK
jgi:uncharacterized membrane protein